MRFDYGATVPWVTRAEDGTISSIAGPERLVLRTPANLHGEDLKTVGEFMVGAGQSVPFVLSHGLSFESPPAPIDPFKALERTEAFWRQWSDRCPHVGPWTDAVKRSLITLKALTYAPMGGIVAAATTSLPKRSGGVRYARPMTDLEHWGVVERWNYPDDSYGDCEDYVLACGVQLLEKPLGFVSLGPAKCS